MRSSNAGFELDKRAAGAAKLLVVSIDDGLFGCHLDWVEAVYQETLPAQVMRNGGGRARPFVVHGGAAAAVVDLRELLGLEPALGRVRRPGHLLVRSGSGLLALPIDACAGVRELDLRGHTPLPTRVLRDGGLPLGHLIELDGRILTVLDPNRLLDDALRTELAPLQAKAQTLLERQARAAALWEEIRREADAERVRAFARLCSRSGRARTAGAARRVLLHMEAAEGGPASTADEPIDRLIGELLRRQRLRSSGALVVDPDGDAAGGTIVFADGRVVDARFAGTEGRPAFTRLLASAARQARFTEGGAWNGPERITESTVALTIAALESMPTERAGRGR